MNTNLIFDFGTGAKALAWAVVEQAILDYLSTYDETEKDEIISFLCDYLPSDKFMKVLKQLNAYEIERDYNV